MGSNQVVNDDPSLFQIGLCCWLIIFQFFSTEKKNKSIDYDLGIMCVCLVVGVGFINAIEQVRVARSEAKEKRENDRIRVSKREWQ